MKQVTKEHEEKPVILVGRAHLGTQGRLDRQVTMEPRGLPEFEETRDRQAPPGRRVWGDPDPSGPQGHLETQVQPVHSVLLASLVLLGDWGLSVPRVIRAGRGWQEGPEWEAPRVPPVPQVNQVKLAPRATKDWLAAREPSACKDPRAGSAGWARRVIKAHRDLRETRAIQDDRALPAPREDKGQLGAWALGEAKETSGRWVRRVLRGPRGRLVV